MRAWIVAALMLTACGQSGAPPAPDVNESSMDAIPTGSFNANGEAPEFEFIADAAAQALELRMNYETIASAPYSPPQPYGDGARIVSGDLTVDLVPEACTVFGVQYPLRATIQAVGREAVSGCAVGRWDTHLLELMPYIDACIAKTPQTRWVSFAGDDGANVTVRLQGDGAERDCVVPRGDFANASVTQRREGVRIAGENAAIFVRGPGENPGGECYDAPEVRGANGEALGWMMDPMGC